MIPFKVFHLGGLEHSPVRKDDLEHGILRAGQREDGIRLIPGESAQGEGLFFLIVIDSGAARKDRITHPGNLRKENGQFAHGSSGIKDNGLSGCTNLPDSLQRFRGNFFTAIEQSAVNVNRDQFKTHDLFLPQQSRRESVRTVFSEV